MDLQSIMSATDTYFSKEDDLATVLSHLAEKHHSCGLICEDKKPIGIITERDIVRLIAKNPGSGVAGNLTMHKVMTHKPISVPVDVNLKDALSLARAHHLRHLPIVDSSGHLIGIVTQSDLVNAYLRLSADYKKLEGLNQELHWLSLEDTLTGLPNRRAMEIDLRHSEAISNRQNQSYCVALVDIDYFKPYNDHYGHPAGDSALQHVSSVMSSAIRESDLLFRYGGEEFLYLMPNTDEAGAMISCNRLRAAIIGSEFEHCKSQLGFLSVSIGLAAAVAEPWEKLVKQADIALYQAKNLGRNTVSSAEHGTLHRPNPIKKAKMQA